jgi:3-carboxy-cis,cis-muconate cycloisomerase
MATLSGLTESICSDPAVLRIFSAESTLRQMLRVEAALARAEAACEVIPADAARVIDDVCRTADILDMDTIASAAVGAGNIAIPFVKQLTAAVARLDPDAARFVHWGATSQDVLDTALVLQLRDALAGLDETLLAAQTACAALATTHRSTLMVGRTWLQHALPTTFGVKAAGWLEALGRSRERLQRAASQCAVLQFGGAAGTLASLGSKAPVVCRVLAAELDLSAPDMPWHAHRDRIAEVATTLGVLAGTLGKIARDISLMAQTEVGEVAEPAGPGRGGSSTMPHKRNPVGCAAVLTVAIRVPGLVSTILSGMVQEHERALGGWQAEWETLPQIVALTGGAVRHLAAVLEGLEIDAPRMAENVALTQGLILAEAFMLALGPHIGRLQAHELVERATKDAVRRHCDLRTAMNDALDADPTTRGLLDADALDRLGRPDNYVGEAVAMVDHVLAHWQASDGSGKAVPRKR